LGNHYSVAGSRTRTGKIVDKGVVVAVAVVGLLVVVLMVLLATSGVAGGAN